MSWINDKEKRGYIGSWAYIVIVFIIIGFLGFNEVPETNKDLITTIIGMLVASLGIVVYTLIGKDEDEVKELKQENKELRAIVEKQQTEIDSLKELLHKLQERVVDKISEIRK